MSRRRARSLALRSTQLRRQSESQFQAAVILLAEVCGWKVYHTHDSRRSNKGFPDLVLVRERTIYRELKTETGKLTPEQRDWLLALRQAGDDADMWRPRDWQHIEDILKSYAPRYSAPRFSGESRASGALPYRWDSDK